VKILIATNNEKKLNEFKRILKSLDISAQSALECGITLDDVEETGSTFLENAFLKANAACRKTGMAAIADDSGLCVDALNGAPGIFSARYGGKTSSAEEKTQKLLNEMCNIPQKDRTAHFECAICCVFPNGDRIETIQTCYGYIAKKQLGSGGFGYDPIFLYDNTNRSFAEMSADEKDSVSHRGKALHEFRKKLLSYIGDNLTVNNS